MLTNTTPLVSSREKITWWIPRTLTTRQIRRHWQCWHEALGPTSVGGSCRAIYSRSWSRWWSLSVPKTIQALRSMYYLLQDPEELGISIIFLVYFSWGVHLNAFFIQRIVSWVRFWLNYYISNHLLHVMITFPGLQVINHRFPLPSS